MRRSWLRAAATPILRRVIGRRLTTVEGLSHIPAEGPFVLVANHTSYLDHFALSLLLEAVRDGDWWILTKRESFATPLGRRWARAWNGIPVDRGQLRASTVKEVHDRLTSGDAVCVYPEGTRGADSRRVGVFRSGAFHFAVSRDVPVIPVAIAGADHVLPKGRFRPRPGRIDVRVGAALTDDPALPKRRRIDALSEQARTWMLSSLREMWFHRRAGLEHVGLADRIADLDDRGLLTGSRRRAIRFVVRAAATDEELGRHRRGDLGRAIASSGGAR